MVNLEHFLRAGTAFLYLFFEEKVEVENDSPPTDALQG